MGDRTMSQRTRITVAVAAAIWAWAGACGAQDLRTMQSLNQVIRTGLLQFRVVSGRISLESSRAGNIQTSNNFDKQQESLSIQSDGGDPKMTYTWTNGKQQLSIEVSNVSKIRIRYSGKADDTQAPVEFCQPLQAKTVLTVGPEGNRQVYSAADVWHLYLAYPAETKRHLTPLLDLLHPNWKLAESAASAEAELLRVTSGDEAADKARWAETVKKTGDERKRWAALVEQLGDESFAKRQAADRALRILDPAVLSYLQQLDFGRLDPEQQFRVHRIIQDISERLGDDAPEQVASWLAGDPSVWLVLLARPDAAVRRQAARQLATMLGGPIPVDPEADPSTQKTQLEQLRARIETPAKEDK
jgi:hypothetical protein